MHKIFTVLSLVLLSASFINAQTFTLNIDEVEICDGESTVTVPILFEDNVLDLSSIQLVIFWDNNGLSYNSVSSDIIDPLQIGSSTSGDTLLVAWAAPPGTFISLVDGDTLFFVTFNVIGGPGTYPVQFYNSTNVSNPNPFIPELVASLGDGTQVSGSITMLDGEVSIADNAPILQNCPADVTLNVDPGLCTAVHSWTEPTVFDCDGDENPPTVAGGTNGGAFSLGTTTVTYTVTDMAGNSNTCSFDVTVEDNIDPTISCPADTSIILPTGTGMVAVDLSSPVTDDNCGVANITYSLSGVTSGSGTFDGSPINFNSPGATMVTFTVTDGSGNSAVCTSEVDITETDSPPITLQLGSATLNCGDTSAQIPIIVENDVTLFSADLVIYWGSGLSFVSAQPGIDGTVITNLTSDTLIMVWNSGGLGTSFNAGDTLINITFDASNAPQGNIPVFFYETFSGANFEVTDQNFLPLVVVALDGSIDFAADEPPLITCPPDISVDCTSSTDTTVTGSATATDACSASVSISFSDTEMQDCGNTKTINRLFIATDDGGLMDSCTQIIVTTDTTPPTAVCQNITIQLDANGEASITPAEIDNGSSDDCGSVNLISVSQDTFNCSDVGNNSVVLTVEDDCGNQSTCEATVTVEDITPPTAVCQDLTVYLDTAGMVDIITDSLNGGSTDNCTNVSAMSASQTSFDCSNVGPNTVTLTIEDDSGNTASCDATVTVLDTVPPTAVCQDITIQLDASGNVSVAPIDVDGGSTDNCGSINLDGVDPSAFDCSNIGDNTVNLSVSDNNGNSASCSATVTVQDILPPTMVCQDITIQLDENGAASITPQDVDGGSTDNCDSLALTMVDPNTFDCSNIGANTVTLTGADESGNTNTCSAQVTVQDTVPPVAVCQDITLQLGAGGSLLLAPSQVDGGSTDNCGDVNLDNVSQTIFNCDNIGDNTAILNISDNNGNTASCEAIVTIQDSLPPTPVCQDVTLYLDENGDGAIIPEDIDGGSTDNCSDVTLVNVEPSTFDCSTLGDNTVTLTIEDAQGNSASCSSTVTVLDTISPDMVCIPTLTVQVGPLNNVTILPSDLDGGSTDNCGSVTLVSAEPSTFNCDNIGPNVVVLLGQDASGNTGECVAIVNVQDTTPPTPVCQDITVELDSMGNVSIMPIDVEGGSFDNCDTITPLSVSPSDFTCDDIGTVQVVYTVSDESGNTANCVANVTVEDAMAPTAICSSDTVYLDENGLGSVEASDLDGGSFDNCVDFTLSASPSSFTCDSIGPNTVILQVEDGSNNVATCEATVTVLDTIAPVLSDCQNSTVELDINGIGTINEDVILVGGSFTDNCETDTIVFTPTTLTCDDIGPNAVTVVASDKSGNTSSCSATVTAVDNLGPTAVCQDITVELSSAGTASITPTDIDGGSFDNCVNVTPLTVEPNTFDCSNVGANAVILTVQDASGNTGSCASTVTVLDVEVPEAVCVDLTVSLDENGNATVTPEEVDGGSTDNCGTPILVDVTPGVFNCGNIGQNQIILTVEDSSENVNTCIANVTVEDNAPPLALCQDITVELDIAGLVNITTMDVDSGSVDNCSAVTFVSVTPNLLDCSFVGDNIVELVVEDAQGNQSTCESAVTVEDNILPVPVCLNTTIALDSAGSATLLPEQVDGGSFDNCGTPTPVNVVPGVFTCEEIGDNQVALTVEDASGNTGICVATITVIDTIAPTAVCQDITVQLDTMGMAMITPSDVDGGSTDNCGTPTPESVTPNTFNCDNIGDNLAVFTVTDGSGNSATCQVTVTVEETVAPIAICQDITVSLDSSGNLTISPEDVDGGSTSNCGMPTPIEVTPNSFDCDNIGDNIVVLTVENAGGNTATCEATVTVEDNTAPTAVCQDITVQLDMGGMASIVAADVDGGSTDNCGTVNLLSISVDSFTCEEIGPNDVILTVEDANGNTDTCTAIVTVEDNIPPTAACVDITLQLDSMGMVDFDASDIDGGSTDNCDSSDLMLTASPGFFDCDSIGVSIVTLTVEDASGNAETCLSVVTVEDTIPPVAVCNDVTIALDSAGQLIVGSDSFEAIDGGSTDNCGADNLSFEVNPTTFDCSDIGPNTATFTVEDASGNQSTCSFTLTVVDDTPPVVNCVDATVQLNMFGVANVSPFNIDGGTSDNCALQVVMVNPNSFDCSNIGDNPVALIATDASGNVDSCTAVVTVEDNIPPSVECPDNKIITSSTPIAIDDISPIVTDNCGDLNIDVDTTYNLTMATTGSGTGDAGGTVFNPGTTNVTYIITDQQGNVDSCTFVVIVNAVDPPQITCPEDTTAFLSGLNCTIPIDGIDVTIENNADIVDTIYYEIVSGGAVIGSGSPSASGEEFLIGMTEVTYFVVDTFGNVASCSFNVTVLDTVPPQITCPTPMNPYDAEQGLCSAVVPDLQAIILECEQDSVQYELSGATEGSGLGFVSDFAFNVGSTTVTYTVVDASGNTNSCAFDIVVDDKQAPMLSCPSDVTISTDPDTCGALIEEFMATAIDNCDTSIFITYNITGVTTAQDTGAINNLFFNPGLSIINISAQDTEGNAAACSVQFTVEDQVAPLVECPADVFVVIDAGEDTEIINDIGPLSAFDNCGIVDTAFTLEQDNSVILSGNGDASGSEFPLGQTTVTYTVTDEAGNTGTCQFIVQVASGNSLGIECPNDTVIALTNLPCETTVDNIALSITADPVLVDTAYLTLTGALENNFTGTDASGLLFPLGVTTISYFVEDTLGVISTCSFDVTIIDSIPPVLTCIDTMVMATTDDDMCVATITDLTPMVEDCGAFALIYTLEGATTGSGAGNTNEWMLNTGLTTVTFTATDQNGLSSSCSIDVEVIDEQGPSISCIGDTTLANDDGICGAALNTFAIVDTSDNCGIVSVLYEFTGATEGTVNGDTSGIVFNVGMTDVVVTVADEDGNEASCNFTVTVEDVKAPTFNCPNDIVVNALPGDTFAVVLIDPEVMDNCEVATSDYTLSGATTGSGSALILDTIFNLDTTFVTFMATDGSGNTATCQFNVIVLPAPDFNITCPADTIVGSEMDTCGAVVGGLDVMVELDPALIDTISYTLSGANIGGGAGSASGTFFKLGTTSVTYFVTDIFGSSATCTFEVIVEDNIAPTFECPGDTVITTLAGELTASFFFTAMANDNCGIDDVSYTLSGATTGSGLDTIDALFNLDTTLVSFLAVDGSGNEVNCEFNVIVVPNPDFTITCPLDTTLNSDTTACGTTVGGLDVQIDLDSMLIDSVIYTLSGATVDTGVGSASDLFYNVGVTTVTYIVSSTLGSSDTCSFTVTVEDNIAPTVMCPSDTTITAMTGEVTASLVLEAMLDDNCGIVDTTYSLDGATTGSGSGFVDTLFNLDTTLVTYVVTDAAGNSDTCTFEVIVLPNPDFNITCPADTTVSTDLDVCGAVVGNLDVDVDLDSSLIDSVVYILSGATTDTALGTASNVFFEVGMTTVTYFVTDIFGAEKSCSFTVTVEDNQAPTLTCPNDTTVTALPGEITASLSFTPEVSDNCEIADTFYTLSGATVGAGSGIVDTTFNLDTTLVTYMVADGSGNVQSCSFEVVVLPSPVLEISCPADTLLSNDPGSCGAIVGGLDVQIDLDSSLIDSVYYILSGATVDTALGNASNVFFNVGETTVTYIVTSTFGSSAECSFTVTVEDDELPVIICPDDIIVGVKPDTCGAFVVWDLPTVLDNCPGVSTTSTNIPGDFFPLGNTVVTYTVVDSAGNSLDCSFNITVQDDIPPVITCPDDTLIFASDTLCAQTLDNLSPVFSENCTVDSVTYTLLGATTGFGVDDASGTLFQSGLTTITYQITDVSGNVGVCEFEVNIEDTIPPVILCPEDVIVTIPVGEDSTVVNDIGLAVAFDNCGLNNITYLLTGATTANGQGDASGSVFDLGVTTVSYGVTDNAGNLTNCSFTVTVVNPIDLMLECPNDTLVDAVTDTCGAFVNGLEFVVLNDPGNLIDTTFDLSLPTNTSGSGFANGSFFDLGTTIVTYTVEDAFGNVGSCNFEVTVQDKEPPVIVCSPDTIVLSLPDTCGAFVDFALATATDNCGINVLSCTSDPGDFFELGTTNITCTVTDNSGNISICSFDVTVVDSVPPMVVCPADITIGNDPDMCGGTLSGASAQIEDNCELSSIVYNLEGATTGTGDGEVNGVFFNFGTTTVSYTVTDASGNVDSCSFMVTVADTSAPTIICPPDTVINAQLGTPIPGVFFFPEVTDNCSIVDTTYTLSGVTTGSGTGAVDTVFELGVTQVTFTVTDGSGNAASCMFDVEVTYNIAPKVECPDNIFTGVDSSSCFATVNGLFVELPGLDSTFIDSVYYLLSGATTGMGEGVGNGLEFNIGETEVTYFVQDIFGNIGECDFDITVEDEELPTVTCPESLIIDNDPGMCSAVIDSLFPISTADNCVLDSVYYTLTGDTQGSGDLIIGQVFNVGTTEITYIAVDSSGNVGSCSLTVTVEDVENPIVSCPNDTIAFTTQNSCEVEVCNLEATISDNCAISSILYTLEGATSESGVNEVDCLTFNEGVTTVNYFAFDFNNNSAECSFTVEVIDTIAPQLDCPSSIDANTISGLCYDENSLVDPEPFDACGVELLTYVLKDTFGMLIDTGIYDPAQEFQFDIGITNVVYYATDGSGNLGTCTIDYFVFDDEAPTITCPEDTVVVTAPGSCNAAVDGLAPEFFENCEIDTIYYYLEKDGVVIDSGGLDASGTVFELGTTTVTYIIKDVAGVEDPDSIGVVGLSDTCSFDVTITQGDIDLSVEPGVSICEAIDIQLMSNASVAGIDSVQWNGPDGFMSTELMPVIDSVTVFAAGTYNLTVFYEGGCSASDSIDVSIFDQPSLRAVAEDLPCTDGNQDAVLEAFDDDNTSITVWTWFNENGEEVNDQRVYTIPNAAAANSGTYTVVGLNGNGCLDTAVVSILITDQPPQPSLVNDCSNMLCLDESCLLIGQEFTPEPDQYVWTASPVAGSGLDTTSNSNITSVRPTAEGVFTYSYSVIFDGCQSEAVTTEIEVLGLPSINNDFYAIEVNMELNSFNVILNDSFNKNANYELEVTTDVSNGNLIDAGDGIFTYIPRSGFVGVDQFVYRICYEDCDFCDFAVVSIDVSFPGDECVIPTIITPNGDDVNDLLRITCLEEAGAFPNNELIIFNQWGDEVFFAAPYENTWDGTRDGNDLPDGVYYYIFKNGEEGAAAQKGYITIFR